MTAKERAPVAARSSGSVAKGELVAGRTRSSVSPGVKVAPASADRRTSQHSDSIGPVAAARNSPGRGQILR